MADLDKITLDGINYALGGSGLTEDAKQALLDCFANVAWIGDDGQDYYDALQSALYPPANLSSISAVYTQSGTVYNTDTLDSLKADLVVTAHWSDSTSTTVPDSAYVLTGTLTRGTSTIVVTYGGKTTTFDVVVTQIYEYYDYLEGDGTAYIDTGLLASTYCSTSYEHEIKASIGTSNSNTLCVYGARKEWGNSNARSLWKKDVAFSAVYCNASTDFTLIPTSADEVHILRTTTDKKVYWDDTLVASPVGASASITHTLNIPLFAEATNGNGSGYEQLSGGYVGAFSNARIYYFKVRNNVGTLIADMRPAMRLADNTPGMHDVVRDVFYPNARATGTLTLGND